MFKENKNHFQNSLSGVWHQLSESKKKRLSESKEVIFYKMIFCNIDETVFSQLYSTAKGRANSSINALVAASILQHHNGWTCEELFNRIDFDLKTRIAFGLAIFRVNSLILSKKLISVVFKSMLTDMMIKLFIFSVLFFTFFRIYSIISALRLL